MTRYEKKLEVTIEKLQKQLEVSEKISLRNYEKLKSFFRLATSNDVEPTCLKYDAYKELMNLEEEENDPEFINDIRVNYLEYIASKWNLMISHIKNQKDKLETAYMLENMNQEYEKGTYPDKSKPILLPLTARSKKIFKRYKELLKNEENPSEMRKYDCFVRASEC